MEQTTGQAAPEWDNVTDDYSSPESFRFPPPLDISLTILEEEEATALAQIETDNLSSLVVRTNLYKSIIGLSPLEL